MPVPRPLRAAAPVALVVVTVLALAGCGNRTGDAGAAPVETTAAATGTGPTASGGDPPATSVAVTVSGGLAGTSRTLRVDQGTPGAAEVLRLAAGMDPVPRPDPGAVPCCDLIRYDVTVALADGATRSAVGFDGDGSDAVEVARAVAASAGRGPAVATTDQR